MSHRHISRHPAEAWIVVADRARARVFSTTWPLGSALTEVEDLVDEVARLSERDTLSDAPTAFVSEGAIRHRGVPQTDFEHRTAERFARCIADRLDRGRLDQSYGRLILVAPPLMLGVLRAALPELVRKLVIEELPHDYTQLTSSQLAEHLAAALTNPLSFQAEGSR